MDIQPIDLGWAAGFLEGEGYFSKGKSCISVQASQVQLEPLTKMQKLFGGSIHKYSQKNRPNCNDFYKWGVHGETAEALMKLLLPLMSPKRQACMIQSLAHYASLPGKNYMKSGRKFCRQGIHPWSGDNIRFDHRGRTFCHACKMAWQQRKRSSVIQEAENLIKVI